MDAIPGSEAAGAPKRHDGRASIVDLSTICPHAVVLRAQLQHHWVRHLQGVPHTCMGVSSRYCATGQQKCARVANLLICQTLKGQHWRSCFMVFAIGAPAMYHRCTGSAEPSKVTIIITARILCLQFKQSMPCSSCCFPCCVSPSSCTMFLVCWV